jgi:hypothetical protein
MTMGKFIGRYSIPAIAGAMFTEKDAWTVEDVAASKDKLFMEMPPMPPMGI